MAFKYKFNLIGESGRMLRKYVLDASTDFQVGDVVAAGTAALDVNGTGEAVTATSGIRVLGVIQGITASYTSDVSPSTNGCGGAFIDAYRTPANNETGAQISALVDVSPFSVYSADLDDTIGTTTGSNRAFYFLDLDTGVANHQLNEASAGAPSSGGAQFVSHGVDPADTNNVLVSIRESAFLGDSGY